MAYQDLLTRQIEQLGMVLRRLLATAVGQDDPGEAHISEAMQALEDAFELPQG